MENKRRLCSVAAKRETNMEVDVPLMMMIRTTVLKCAAADGGDGDGDEQTVWDRIESKEKSSG